MTKLICVGGRLDGRTVNVRPGTAIVTFPVSEPVGLNDPLVDEVPYFLETYDLTSIHGRHYLRERSLTVAESVSYLLRGYRGVGQ